MPNPTAIPAIEDYTVRGWPVFPCDTKKRPKTPNGFHDAHLDFELHAAHWTANPTDTVGIATGYSNGSRLLVVDLDSYKEGGHPEWDALAAEHGGLPATRLVRTGQGGYQHYYLAPRTIRSTTATSRGDGVTNVDIRCDGGYVIAAPSRTIFGAYEIVDDRDPIPAPQWVVDFAERRRGDTPATTGSGRVPAVRSAGLTATDLDFDRAALTPAEVERLNGYAVSAVERELSRLDECRDKAVPNLLDYRGPEWDQTTYEVACNLIEFSNSPWNDFSEDDAHRLLLERAPRDTDFDDARVVAKWDSARRTVADTVRAVPVNPSGGGYFIPFEGGDGGVIDPASFFSKGEGLNVTLLAQAVLDMGPLAIEDTIERGTWSYRRGVWVPTPNEITDRCAVLLGAKFRPNHVTTVAPVLKQRLAADGKIVTCEPASAYVNVTNGMLDWSTGELLPHSPDYLSTVQFPVEWDAEAVCPRFDSFVASIMPDDAVEYLWEVLGYMVYSGNPLQKAILLHGGGSNGKGTLIRVIAALLGQRNVSAVTLQEVTEGKFEVASLFGKIANLAGDIDPSYMKSTARFKAITGEDMVSAQRKFEAPFAFKCWATPLFSANEFWKSADTTSGYKRRWLLVPFPNTFTIRPGFDASLFSEMPGILAHAVASLRVLMARGDFAPPKSALDEKERFELAADQVREWLDDDPAIVVSDPRNTAASIPASDAYSAYRAWCETNGTGPLNASKFKQRMESLGYQWHKVSTRRILGLSIDRQLRHLRPSDTPFDPTVRGI